MIPAISSSPRLKKQVIYAGVFLGIPVLMLLIVTVIILWPEPNCFDNTQNKNEEGIDCGGICEKQCFLATVKPVVLLQKPKVFYLDDSRSSVLVEIQNPNQDLAARSFSYEFKLYDEDDQFLKSLSGRSFIYAGEIKQLFFPTVDFPARAIHRAEFTLRDPLWIPSAQFSKPQLVLRDHRTVLENNGLEVRGTLINKDTTAVLRVFLLAVFYGEFSQPVGASQTELGVLGPGATRTFVLTHPAIKKVNPAGTRVFIFAPRP